LKIKTNLIGTLVNPDTSEEGRW